MEQGVSPFERSPVGGSEESGVRGTLTPAGQVAARRAAPDGGAGGARHSSRGHHGGGPLTARVAPEAALGGSRALGRCPELTQLVGSACTSCSLRYYDAGPAGGVPGLPVVFTPTLV